MVGVAGRSRGCAICRRRKIKCDLGQPTCSQCLRKGYDCPGPVSDSFLFIQAVARTSSSSSSRAVRPRNRLKSASQRAPSDLLRNPPSGQVFEQLFVSQFIDSSFFDAHSGFHWVSSLPDIHARSTLASFRHSLRGTGLAFYGHLSGDEAFQNEGRRWYAESLASQRSLLQSGSKALITEEAIASGMLMCYFEMIAGTNGRAWFQHIAATARMLEMRGPEACREGVAHELFCTLRLGVFYVSMATNTTHRFAGEDWCTVPFQRREKTCWDSLVDVLLYVPTLLQRVLALLSERPRPHQDQTAFDDAKEELLSMVKGALLRLDQWQAQHASQLGDWSMFPAPTPSTADPYVPRKITYPDISTSIYYANYHAVRIIGNSLLWTLEGTRPSKPYEIETLTACEAVLSVVEFIELAGAGIRSNQWTRCVLMVFPLKNVVSWGTCARQRKFAYEKLRSLGPQTTLDGLRRAVTSAPLGLGLVLKEQTEAAGGQSAQIVQKYRYVPDADDD